MKQTSCFRKQLPLIRIRSRANLFYMNLTHPQHFSPTYDDIPYPFSMPRFLLAAGSNGAAQLGIGHRDDVASFTTCRFASSSVTTDISNSNILDLKSGANHSLLLLLPNGSARRQVWATGTNEYRQIGPQFSAQTTLNEWTPLNADLLLREAGIDISQASAKGVAYEPIRIGCSWTTSFIVFSQTRNGDRLSDIVIAFGTNDFGELGCATTANDEGSSLTRVSIVRLPGWQDALSASPNPEKRMHIERLAVGQRHMACVCRISASGRGDSSIQKVYGWGAARHGQLSAQSYTDASTAGTSSAGPSSSSSPVPQIRAASKSARRPTKTTSPKVQKPKYPSTQTTPAPIDLSNILSPNSSAQITNISCGASHTVLLLSDGRVMGLGSNAKGQLELPCTEKKNPVRAVGCTWNGTVGYTASDNGDEAEVCSTGSNTHGQLGRSTETVSQNVLLTESVRPTKIRKLICGSEHVLVITDSAEEDSRSRLYGWGWNEHGNLALGTTVDQWTPVDIPVVAPSREGYIKVVDAWAGCGTSWVLVECE